MSFTVNAIKAEKKENQFDLFEIIIQSFEKGKTNIAEGDVLVISSKYVSQSQGRQLSYDFVKPSIESMALSKKFQINSNIAEVIIRESDVIFGGIPGFVITSSDNILAPNAGIDKSNVSDGKIILYPNEPYLVAEQMRRKIFIKFSVHVGVIIVDSRLMPSRIGTIGIAISCAGIEPVKDMRAKKDLHGKSLKVTFQAVVDNLASIANYKMGEGSESKPLAIIKNADVKLTDRKIKSDETSISYDQCVYVRGLKNYK